jgi:hypothetical protein
MAIIKPTKTVEVIPQDRTRLIEIASPFGQVPILTAHRESIEVAAGEVVKRENALSTTRTLAQVAELSHTCADGTVVKVRHLAECLPAWIDAWAQEDAQ